MADEVTTTTGTEPIPTSWTDGFTPEQKTFVTERGFKDVSAVLEAVPKSTEWTGGLTPEQKGLVDSKGFEGLGSLVDSYGNLEKLKGVPENQLIRIPDKSAESDPEAWNAYYAKLGRPEKAEGYELKFPEDGGQVDEKTAGWFRETCHKLGLSKSQGEKFVESWNEHAGQLTSANDESIQLDIKGAENKLRAEWGLAYTQNKTVAENAAAQFGITSDVLGKLYDNMGIPETLKLFHSIGVKAGEANFHDGSGGGNPPVKTPEAARHEINQLKQNKDFFEKLQAGEGEATEKWHRLHAQLGD